MTKPIRKVLYTTAEVSEASGATARQLQWWDERGVLEAQHEGHARHYDAEQLEFAKKLVQLRGAGLSLRCAVRVLQKHKVQGPVLVVRGDRGTVVTL